MVRKLSIALFLFFSVTFPLFAHAELESELMAIQPNSEENITEYFLAHAISVTDRVMEGTELVPEQKIIVEGLSGTFKGKKIEFFQQSVYGIRQIRYVKNGDILILQYSNWNIPPYHVVTHYRIPQMMMLISIFVVVVCALTARRGVRAIGALITSFALLYTVSLPLMTRGYSPLLVLSVTACVILLLSIFSAHGFQRKSFVAAVGGFSSIGFAALLGSISIYFLRLNGTGMSEATYLQFGSLAGISLRGLLLGGIILSTVGILDDVTTVQTVTVKEMLETNPNLTRHQLYRHAMVVGREHIISMVNTMFIVFAGSTVPVFLFYMFDSSNIPLWVKINSDEVMEEFTRSLAGSFALVLAVPITTLLAAYVFTRPTKNKQKKELTVSEEK
jgi:uncharacterized membrane protein